VGKTKNLLILSAAKDLLSDATDFVE